MIKMARITFPEDENIYYATLRDIDKFHSFITDDIIFQMKLTIFRHGKLRNIYIGLEKEEADYVYQYLKETFNTLNKDSE